MLDFLALDDLTGVNDAALEVGVVNGTLDPKKGAWTPPGTIDWWFLANASDIDGVGLPLYKLSPASIVNRSLTGGPSTVVLNYNGSPLKMLGARLNALVGVATNVPAPPPSALAAGLTVFQTVSANTAGSAFAGTSRSGRSPPFRHPRISASGRECLPRCLLELACVHLCRAGNPVATPRRSCSTSSSVGAG